MTPSDFITTAEVARLLKISPSTVQRMAREGRIAAFRVGKLWRFPAQSPGILLYKQEQKLRRKDKSAPEKEPGAPRNGLKEFAKLSVHLGFNEPFSRDMLAGGER
ncbi:DNA-binding protein [candidate division KSB1 bacterium]|nr:MAG: DNA-binding protein [candidate division KSB1 bacterium]